MLAQKNEVLKKWEAILEDIWKKSAGPIGEPVLRLIFNACIKKCLPAFEFLKKIKISDKGFDFEKLEKDISKYSEKEIEKGFQNLLNQILIVFSILWDNLMIQYLHFFDNFADRIDNNSLWI